MKYADLRCVKCNVTVEPSLASAPDDDEAIPPNDALLFLSYGNYGSRLFDPVDSSEYLLVVICDSCAGRLAADGNVMHVMTERPAVTRRRQSQLPWQPPGDAGVLP